MLFREATNKNPTVAEDSDGMGPFRVKRPQLFSAGRENLDQSVSVQHDCVSVTVYSEIFRRTQFRIFKGAYNYSLRDTSVIRYPYRAGRHRPIEHIERARWTLFHGQDAMRSFR